MKAILIILLTLSMATLLALFPDVSNQVLRVEAFGWVFETRQGVFAVALLLLLTLVWLLRRLLGAILAGPGKLLRSLRMGGIKRRDQRLREGMSQWLDMRGDLGAKAFKKTSGVLPDWAHDLLKILVIPANEQPLPSEDMDDLQAALSARLATDPHAFSKPDLVTRKAHLKAWLAVHPDAPLAVARLADVAEEEGDWEEAATRLQQLWHEGHRPAAMVKPRLATAYVRQAEQVAAEQPAQRSSLLRKALRLDPANTAAVLATGQQHIHEDNVRAAVQLWTGHLEQYDDVVIAKALLAQLGTDPMQGYRSFEKRKDSKPLLRWVRASLAHAAGLSGLATESLDALLTEHPRTEFLRTRADWYAEAGQCEQAATYYRKALDSLS